MRKLPQADELPHAEEGYDPARVEEAFAAFADRVRELESVASELRAELKAVRAERTAPARFEDEDWPAERGLSNTGLARSPDWVAAVPPPFRAPSRRSRGSSSRESFLLLVAVLAGLANLSAAWIVLVMAVAWVLVVLTEWAAAAKRSRWRLEEIAPPADAALEAGGRHDRPVGHAGGRGDGRRERPGPRVEDDRRQAPGGAGDRSRARARAGAEAPAADSAAASPPRRALPILPAIPGRRSLAAAVAAAFLVTVPGASALSALRRRPR